MERRDITIRAFDRPEFGHVAIVITAVDAEGRWAEFAKPLEFYPRELGSVGQPTLTIEYKAAQALMDSLWATGLRPKDVGTAGQLGATERHLEDMRKIAFAKLGVE